MLKNLKNKKKKGFTLIELIIVIAIIAILAAIAIPKFGDVRKKANISADIANAKQIQGAVSIVIADGKANLPDTEVTFIYDGTADATDKTGIEVALKSQLQDSVPKLKAVDAGKRFKVTVTTEGNVSISTETANTPIYPNGTGDYAQ